MNVFKYIIVSAIMISVTVLLVSGTVTPVKVNASEYGSGSVISSDGLNPENIKIDIIEFEPTEENDGMVIYDGKVSDTVLTDKNGIYFYSIPEEDYQLMVELSSLPEGSGVNEFSLSVKKGEKAPDIVLGQIEKIEINGIDEENVNVYDSHGNRIYTPISVEKVLSEKQNDPASIMDTGKMVFEVTAYANGCSEGKTIIEDISRFDYIDKVNYLYNNKVIDEDKRAELYLEYWKNDDIDHSGTTVYEYLLDYCLKYPERDLSKKIASDIKAGLFEEDVSSEAYVTSVPAYRLEKTFIVNGFYKVHYEGDDTDPIIHNDYLTATQVSQISSELSSIYSYFFVTNAFNLPDKQSGESYYHIYLGTFPKNHTVKTSVGSYICINAGSSTVTDRTTNNGAAFYKSMCHEIFHSIMYKYNGHTAPDPFFSESFASFAGVTYANYVLGKTLNWTKAAVNDYYDTVEISFDDNSASASSRNYGELVLPKYIYEQNGNMTAIKYILNCLLSSNSDIEAIDNGLHLLSSSYSFKNSFVYCSLYNINPSAYFNYASNWDPVSITRNNTNYSSNYVNPNACKYFNYTATSSSSTKVEITITAINNPQYLKTGIMRTYGNGNTGITVLSDYSSTSTIRKIVVNGFNTGSSSSSVNKVSVVNTSFKLSPNNSSTFSITRTVT